MGTLGGNVSLRVGVNPPICSHWCTKTHMCFAAPCREPHFYTAQRREASPRRKKGCCYIIKAPSPPHVYFFLWATVSKLRVFAWTARLSSRSHHKVPLSASLSLKLHVWSDHKIIFVSDESETIIDFPEPPEITSKCDYLHKTDQMLQL